MANIVSTTLEVYKGTTVTPGNLLATLVESGSPASVVLDGTSLSPSSLMPGCQYSVRAKVLNDEQYESPFTALRNFITQVAINWPEEQVGMNVVKDVHMQFSGGRWVLVLGDMDVKDDGTYEDEAGYICYDTSAVTAANIRVRMYVNNVNNFNTAVYKEFDLGDLPGFAIANNELPGLGAQFSFQENTTYYVWIAVTDNTSDATRLYVNPSGATAATAYAPPVVTLSNPTHTYNSVGAVVSAQSSEQITGVQVRCVDTGGGTIFVKNLTATSQPQSFTFTNGDIDANGNTVVINDNTTYRVTATVTTATQNAQSFIDITTDQQAVSSVAITGVTTTPTSATVAITYGMS